MAFIFVKRAGAPAGAINFTLAGATYLIDDASNTTITETDPSKASNLMGVPQLQLQGTSGASYVPSRGAVSQELAYSEMTTSFLALNTTAASSLFPLQISFAVVLRPVYVEFFCPFVTVASASNAVAIAFADAAGTQAGLNSDIPGFAFGGTPVLLKKRYATPGNYTVRILTWGSVASNYQLSAGPGGSLYDPCYLAAFEA